MNEVLHGVDTTERLRRSRSRAARSLPWMVSTLLLASAVSAAAAPTATRTAASAHAVTHKVVERDWVPANRGPQPSGKGAMAYDEARHQTVLVVPGHPSQTWVFDGGTRTWSQKFPATSPMLVNASVAYDAARGKVVLFGTNADANLCSNLVPGETWTWDGTTWTQLHPANAPDECAGLGNMTMTALARQHFVALSLRGPVIDSEEVWRWNGTTWSFANYQQNTGAAIAGYNLSGANGAVYSFGGTTTHYFTDDSGATRIWNGSPTTRWTTRLAGGGPADPQPRGLAAMTQIGSNLVMFGGVAHAPEPHLLADTWRNYIGKRWVRVATRHSPPPMAGASLAYDTDHDLGILYGAGTWLYTAARAGGGYLMCASDGGVFAFGDAHFYGSAGSLHLNAPVVGIARTPTRRGYWLVASDGGVFAFGDAPFLGSAANLRLTAPIVGIAATPSGRGYWLVARDGGVFTFGDAQFFGSAAPLHLNEPIVGIASAQWSYSGLGYWLVDRTGAIFGFGDAPRQWPPRPPSPPQRSIVGIAATPVNPGYWLVNPAGRVWDFSAPHFGSLHTARPAIVAIAAGPTNFGYWLFGADGTTHPFGDAHAYGNAPAHLRAPIVGAVAT